MPSHICKPSARALVAWVACLVMCRARSTAGVCEPTCSHQAAWQGWLTRRSFTVAATSAWQVACCA
jgi:hypothetical protein